MLNIDQIQQDIQTLEQWLPHLIMQFGANASIVELLLRVREMLETLNQADPENFAETEKLCQFS